MVRGARMAAVHCTAHAPTRASGLDRRVLRTVEPTARADNYECADLDHPADAVGASLGLPSRGPRSVTLLAHAIGQSANRHVLARHGSCARPSRVLAFSRKAGRHPVELAGLVVMHIAETEGREPRRGPGREVSSGIPAAHDDGTARV